MKTRYDAVPANFFLTFTYFSFIALVAGFFAMVQVNYTIYPAGNSQASAARNVTLGTRAQQMFRSLVRLPTFSFTVPSRVSDEEMRMSPKALLDRWQPFIAEASQRFVIPEDWIRTVIRIESGGRTMLSGKPITSEAGAMGVMQLMEDTYGDMRVRHGLGADPYNVRDNILAGTAYLHDLYQRYGYPRLFAAYNAGPGRLEEHLKRGSALPKETRNYLRMATNGASHGSLATAKHVRLSAAKPRARVAAIYQPAS